MSETLQFIVMITPMESRLRTIDALCDAFPDAKRLKPHSFELQNNWFELWDNRDADPNLATNMDEGYLFFDGRLEATPQGQVEERSQIDLAVRVVSAIRAFATSAVVCANFEDRVDEMLLDDP